MQSLPRYIRLAPRIASAVAVNPEEIFVRLVEKLADIKGHRRGECPSIADTAWEQKLHAAIGAPWPCPATAEFWALWPSVMETLTSMGLSIGPAAFGVWNDGEPELTRAVWCLTRHLRPMKVVETGVARGVTSRFVLEALERNGCGQLWSIDLPPLLEPRLHAQIGAAVGTRFADRWHYVKGSSRRRLRGLLSELGQIDIFIHDSAHTERNLRFEIDQVRPAIRPGGAIVADDIDLNWSFHDFRESDRSCDCLVCEAHPVKPDPRRFNAKGLFGVAVTMRPTPGAEAAGNSVGRRLPETSDKPDTRDKELALHH